MLTASGLDLALTWRCLKSAMTVSSKKFGMEFLKLGPDFANYNDCWLSDGCTGSFKATSNPRLDPSKMTACSMDKYSQGMNHAKVNNEGLQNGFNECFDSILFNDIDLTLFNGIDLESPLSGVDNSLGEIPFLTANVQVTEGQILSTAGYYDSDGSASTQTTATEARLSKGDNLSKLYMCEIQGCQKSFTRKYNLTSHIRAHKNERPYTCKLCDASFTRRSDLTRHSASPTLHGNVFENKRAKLT